MTDQVKGRFYGVDLGGADRLHVSERPRCPGRPTLWGAVARLIQPTPGESEKKSSVVVAVDEYARLIAPAPQQSENNSIRSGLTHGRE